MEDLKIKTVWGDLTIQGFDDDNTLYIELEDDDNTMYTWLTVSETKQLVRHLIGALEEVGEKI